MLMKKESCNKLSLMFSKSVKGEESKHKKNDDGGQVVVAFTMTEINYLTVSLFCDLVWSLSDLYLWH